MFLNSANHARVVIEEEGLQCREHEYASLAKLGIKQYKVTQKLREMISGAKQDMGPRTGLRQL